MLDDCYLLPDLVISQMIMPTTTTTIKIPVHIPALKIPAIAEHPPTRITHIINKK